MLFDQVLDFVSSQGEFEDENTEMPSVIEILEALDDHVLALDQNVNSPHFAGIHNSLRDVIHRIEKQNKWAKRHNAIAESGL